MPALLSLGLAAAWLGSAAAAPDPLAAYRWRSRLLLLFAADDEDPDLARQRALLAPVAADREERDLVTIETIGDRTVAGLDAAALRHRFGLARDGFVAVLVGKDGGEKLRETHPLDPARLFAVIDAMPMRRREQ